MYIADEAKNVRFLLSNGPVNQDTLFFLGINPSKASDLQSDPTWTRVQKMAALLSYKNASLLNIFPYRATHLTQVPPNINLKELHQHNLAVIQQIFFGFSQSFIWCGWGNLIEYKTFFLSMLKDIFFLFHPIHVRWLALEGLTQKGHPRHPMARGKNSFSYCQKLLPFDLEAYLQSLEKKFQPVINSTLTE